MDRPTSRKDAGVRGGGHAPGGALVLPSRRPALHACREGLSAGPVLLTGEAGVGKSWLWGRLGAESPPSGRWLGVDLTPADGPAEFYRLVGHRLGLVEPGPAPSRLALIDFLAERHADGERPALVIDEAHNVSAAVWEEIRVLINRLGEPGGFSALVLVGQTPLARRFATRPFAGIEARLAARSHLGPIDADEALELLEALRPGRPWSTAEVEALHRDTAGNPGRLLRRAGATPAPRPAGRQADRAVGVGELEPAPVAAARPPLPAQARPPLIVEDHLIEVGWSPEDDPNPDHEGPGLGEDDSTTPEGEEEVRDHYAALQAWQEWADNQARRVPTAPEAAPVAGGPEDHEGEPPASPLADRPTVWAEGEQRFAPFGQLFSRMSQAREPD